MYGRDRFISDEEKREYDERVKEEIDQFTSACLDAGECAQPMEAWMKIRERLYIEIVAKRPKTAKVRNVHNLFCCSSAGHCLVTLAGQCPILFVVKYINLIISEV